jgi:hypothetical protein
MATSVSDLKKRLRNFLADPRSEEEFQVWFAHTLREASSGKDTDLEALAHAVQKAFSDFSYGLYTPEQLLAVLKDFAKPIHDQTAPEYIIVFPWPPVIGQGDSTGARNFDLNEINAGRKPVEV